MEYLIYIFVLCTVIAVIVTHFVIQSVNEKYQRMLNYIRAVTNSQSETEAEICAISDRLFDIHEKINVLLREGFPLFDTFSEKTSTIDRPTEKESFSCCHENDHQELYQPKLPGFDCGDEIIFWRWDSSSDCGVKTAKAKDIE